MEPKEKEEAYTTETDSCGYAHKYDGCDCKDACGCGHSHAPETVMITFDDNTETECVVLGIFEAKGREYIALVPVGDEEVLVYRYGEENDEAVLSQIESDDEYEAVSAAFHEMMAEDEDEA